MKKKTISCVCGKNAELRRLSAFKVYLIKCECGRRTGADTEAGAISFWNKLIEKDNREEREDET